MGTWRYEFYLRVLTIRASAENVHARPFKLFPIVFFVSSLNRKERDKFLEKNLKIKRCKYYLSKQWYRSSPTHCRACLARCETLHFSSIYRSRSRFTFGWPDTSLNSSKVAHSWFLDKGSVTKDIRSSSRSSCFALSCDAFVSARTRASGRTTVNRDVRILLKSLSLICCKWSVNLMLNAGKC